MHATSVLDVMNRLIRQLRKLPVRLKIWAMWLGLSTVALPLVFVANDFFRAALICQMLNLIFGGYLAIRFGLVKLLSLSHLLFWTPMLAKYARYYQSLDTLSLWLLALMFILTVSISLVLDARDFWQWCRGDRSPLAG